jgi:hypothetical protein
MMFRFVPEPHDPTVVLGAFIVERMGLEDPKKRRNRAKFFSTRVLRWAPLEVPC